MLSKLMPTAASFAPALAARGGAAAPTFVGAPAGFQGTRVRTVGLGAPITAVGNGLPAWSPPV